MTLPKRFSEVLEEAILHKVNEIEQHLDNLVGDGESLEDVLRHDEGHDKWHAMNGDSPCTSEEDCAAKRATYKDDKCNCNSQSCPQCGKQVITSSWVEENSNLDSDW